jgi:hypothetical protein
MPSDILIKKLEHRPRVHYGAFAYILALSTIAYPAHPGMRSPDSIMHLRRKHPQFSELLKAASASPRFSGTLSIIRLSISSPTVGEVVSTLSVAPEAFTD